ncbi:MAG: hypothetical protein AAGH60_00810 [Pseudomonadota bacterium]
MKNTQRSTRHTRSETRSLIHGATLTLAALVLAVTLAGGFVLTAPKPVQAQSCLSSSETRSLISSGQVMSFSSVQNIVRSRGFSEVASVSLCRGGSSYVYQVVAVRSSGQSARLTIDAVSGNVF